MNCDQKYCPICKACFICGSMEGQLAVYRFYGLDDPRPVCEADRVKLSGADYLEAHSKGFNDAIKKATALLREHDHPKMAERVAVLK